jgi:hypothetical protein
MEKLPIDFNSFSKELLGYLLQYVILSRELQKEHKFKNGDIVFYYDSQFSNIHRLNLRKDSREIDLTNEVLYNTKCYNEDKEWDLLTGIYFWLPKNLKEKIENLKKILERIKEND